VANNTSRHGFWSSTFPLEITTLMYFYRPICGYDPYTAFLLEQCHVADILSRDAYEQKQQEEQARLEAMSEEEREEEIERRIDEGVEAMHDRRLNDYNGESWLNEEDEALEGADGIFDLSISSLVSKFPKEQEQESQQKLWEAYHQLSQKGFLRHVASSEQLEHLTIERALRTCYPAIFTEEENAGEQ